MTEIRNKRAFFDYEILERVTAGIVLLGPEVKSIRAGRGSLASAFVSVRNGEAFIKNFQVPKWEYAQYEVDPMRDKKLLLKKREINKLEKKLEEQGLTVVPLKLFFTRGYAKIELGVARGKKQYDKRATIKKRDEERRIAGKLRKY